MDKTIVMLIVALVGMGLMLWSLQTCVVRIAGSECSYQRCFWVFVVTGAISAFGWFLIFHYVHITLTPFLQGALAVFLPVLIYQYAFQLSFNKALLVHVLSVCLSSIASVLLVLVLVLSGFFKGMGLTPRWEVAGLVKLPYQIKHYVQLTQLQWMGNAVCGCLDDTECMIKKRSRFYGQLDALSLDDYEDRERKSLASIETRVMKCLMTHHHVQQESKQWEQPQKSVHSKPALPESLSTKPVVKTRSVPAKAIPPRKTFVEVALPSLSQYEGRIVMVVMNNDTVKQGKLHKAGGRSLKLHQFHHGGHSIVKLRFRDIRMVKVLHEQ